MLSVGVDWQIQSIREICSWKEELNEAFTEPGDAVVYVTYPN